MKNNRVALIARSPFPFGDVCTVRYSTYCKALANEGVFTKVYILHPSKSPEAKSNRNTRGVYDGVHFEYLSTDTYWTASTLSVKKQLLYMYYVLKSLFLLRKDGINVIILYHHDNFNTIIYRIFCSLFNILFLTDQTEFPYKFPYNSDEFNNISKYLKKIHFCSFDKYIVMTHSLHEYYCHFLNKNKDLFFHLPMTVDLDRFKNIEELSSEPSYIACVFGVHNRDCIFDTIKSYKLYVDNKDDAWTLNLYGDFYKLKIANELLLYIKNNQLENKVIIKGKIISIDMPKILTNAKCLITTAREYVSGGFPTKLGEYLATRKPIVATKAGEIPRYLEDGISCFLATPGDIEEIAWKLLYVHDNYNEALCVAERGYIIAKNNFNAEKSIQELINFFD